MREFRRRRVNRHNDVLIEVRKCLVEGDLVLPPLQLAGEKVICVRVDGEMTRGVSAACDRDGKSEKNSRPGSAAASGHDRHDKSAKHMRSLFIDGCGVRNPTLIRDLLFIIEPPT